MLRIGWYRLWIAMGCFAAILTPLQLIGGTVLPQYADDVHLGVTSCAGSTCHGATSPWKGSTVLQNEYITWDRYDPHSKAYSVLLNDVSKQRSKAKNELLRNLNPILETYMKEKISLMALK